MLAAAAGQPTFPEGLTVPELRAYCDEGVLARLGMVRQVSGVQVEDLVSPGGVPVRLYVPEGAEPGALHIHLHGGGWWMGSIATVDPMCRELAVTLGTAVLSVDYRLAPEHAWPAGADDCYEVLGWMSESYAAVSLGGESAGANLAAVVALMSRDRGGPRIVAQWLDVGAYDLSLPEDESVRAFGTGYGLEVAQLGILTGWYQGDVEDPYVSPACADLAGFPPTVVTTAELDPLRDQGKAFAEQLAAAGVPVDYRVSPGHIHGSSWFTAIDEGTAAWYEEVVALLAAHRNRVSA